MPAKSIRGLALRRVRLARRSRTVGLMAGLALVMAAALPGSGVHAATTGPQFAPAVVLPGGQGGEPSIAIDTSPTSGRNYIYVSAIGDANGPLEWHSYDGGATFSQPVPFDLNGPLRGGDSDIVVNTDGTVIATDLDVTHASVQLSTDHGQTFNDGTTTAPEDDRPWLTANGSNVYVAYHDFVAEDPVVCFSTDGGNTFPTCNQAFGAGGSPSNCAENTIPARPLVIDPANGNLNFLYSCSTAAENAAHPPYGPLHDYYLAQSTDGGVTWTSYPVFIADTSNGKAPNYANIFGTLAADSAGNLYTLIDGTADDPNVATNPYHVYLLVSKDHGQTWSQPIQVDHERNGAGTHVLAHMVVTRPGNVDVVWYGTTATGEPNGVCGTIGNQHPCPDGFPDYTDPSAPAWHVYMAQTRTALSATPAFRQGLVDTAINHYGRICTNGLVCGSSDRSLLDFISVGVDCSGLAHVAYGSNTRSQERKGQTFVRVASQAGGTTIASPVACDIPVG
ncbi:MAG: glycoside hydrolase [Actinomycetota bacterium]|nr:glycoside hydrolase [Actinomycetota bacterium]